MNAVTLNHLIGYGPLLSVSHRLEAYEAEDMRRAVADGEWQVWGRTIEGEEWLASGGSEAEARSFAEQAGLFLGVPMRAVP